MKTNLRLFSISVIILFTITSCEKPVNLPVAETEFNWEMTSPAEQGWNESAVDDMIDYLESTNSKSFMIIADGKIAMEEYFDGHTAEDTWQWNSAGKTLVTTAIGIAHDEGIININNKVSDYLGNGWTSASQAKEDLITVRSLLTMTSGLDDEPQIVRVANLTYLADAGSRWAYGNVFQRLMDVIEQASDEPYEDFFNREVRDKLGMDGFWNNGLIYRIYHSNTRSMARFGLMTAAGGMWEGERLLESDYLNASTSTSQDINPSYGYMWWLNGKSSFMLPGTQQEFSGMLVPSAPADMYSALGKDEQRLYIVPSKNMIVVRMGEATGGGGNDNFALSSFDDLLWEKINAVIE